MHTDTSQPFSEPDLGDIIVAQGSPPVWDDYALVVPAANVRNALAVDNGETVPTWKTTLDATNPAAVSPTSVAAPGTSLIYSHRDHVHGASDIASAASLAAFIALFFSTSVVTFQALTDSSTAFQNVTAMAVPLGANEVWRFNMTLIFISTVLADFKFQFTVPAGATLYLSSGPVTFAGLQVFYQNTAAATPMTADGTAANVAIEVSGTVINAGTAGNLQLQAAQNVAQADAAADRIIVGSNIFARRV